MYYFAYGSNMSSARIRSRIQTVKTLGVAHLKNYELQFHKIGSDGTAKCNITFCSNNDAFVYGILYELPNDAKKRLDKIEGVGQGYAHKEIELVLDDNCNYRAETYIALITAPNLFPFYWYKYHVLFGAMEHELPQSYINNIEKIKSIPDANKPRQQMELSIYR